MLKIKFDTFQKDQHQATKKTPTIKHLLPWGKRHVPPLQGHWRYCCEPLRQWQVCQSWLCIPDWAEAHSHNGEPDSSCPSEWHTTDGNLLSVGKWCSWPVQWWTFRGEQILMKLESYKYRILWKSHIFFDLTHLWANICLVLSSKCFKFWIYQALVYIYINQLSYKQSANKFTEVNM